MLKTKEGPTGYRFPETEEKRPGQNINPKTTNISIYNQIPFTKTKSRNDLSCLYTPTATITHLNEFLLLLAAGTVSTIPLFNVVCQLGKYSLHLTQLGLSFSTPVLFIKEHLDLATASDFLPEPALPFALDDFSLDTVHHPKRHEEIVPVCGEALTRLLDSFGCALGHGVPGACCSKGKRGSLIAHHLFVECEKAIADVLGDLSDGRVGDRLVDVSYVDRFAHDIIRMDPKTGHEASCIPLMPPVVGSL